MPQISKNSIKPTVVAEISTKSSESEQNGQKLRGEVSPAIRRSPF
jgi:hypothetical protein